MTELSSANPPATDASVAGLLMLVTCVPFQEGRPSHGNGKRRPYHRIVYLCPFNVQGPKFTYVYDCGSEHSSAFNSELALYRATSSGHTDILFVSHLHADHINGIDRLQAMSPATTVMVPYLDLIDRLLFLLVDLENGSLSQSGLEYFRDPVDWWRRRGAERIVFLQAGGGDDTPPERPGEPDGPTEGPGPDEEKRPTEMREGKTPASRLASYLRQPRGDVPVGLTPAAGTIHDEQAEVLLAGPGSSFQLEWQSDTSATWRRADWILMPYVHPVDDTARKRFLKDLKKELKVRGKDEARLSAALLEHLRSYEKTKRLVEIYSSHFGHGHNALSMSLYSGPFSRTPDPSTGLHGDWHAWLCYTDASHETGGYRQIHPALGWLGTGDATLRQSKWRDPWRNFYQPFADQIAIMTLPHHGSAHNFHPDIVTFGNLDTALATTTETRNRVARMRETLGEIEALGIGTRVIDHERQNRMTIYCERSAR